MENRSADMRLGPFSLHLRLHACTRHQTESKSSDCTIPLRILLHNPLFTFDSGVSPILRIIYPQGHLMFKSVPRATSPHLIGTPAIASATTRSSTN